MDTLGLAQSMKKELEMLIKVRESDDLDGEEFSEFLEGCNVDFGVQEKISLEAASGLMSKLRALLEPFRAVVDDKCPWEEKSAVVRLAEKMKKSKRNKIWRKRKRKRVAQTLAKERDQFDELDREADEWRATEIAKETAQQRDIIVGTVKSSVDISEGDEDKINWATFQQRVEKAPEQVLRYSRDPGARPLWPMSSGRPSKADIPKCNYCGADRIFEFQILPQLLYYFNVKNEPDPRVRPAYLHHDPPHPGLP